MIGIGVGIDYALFIITRYREWVGRGLTPEEATAAALDSAGRSVIFAGATVVVSLLGLLLMGLPFVAGLGLAAATTVALVMGRIGHAAAGRHRPSRGPGRHHPGSGAWPPRR